MDSKIFLLRKIHKYSGNVRGSEVPKKSSMDSWLRSTILCDPLFPFIANAVPLLPVLLQHLATWLTALRLTWIDQRWAVSFVS